MSTTFLRAIEKAHTEANENARADWEQLVSDTVNDRPRDPFEALQILERNGKRVADLESAVNAIKSSSALQAEYRDLKAKVSKRREVNEALTAATAEFVAFKAAHEQRVRKLEAELNGLNTMAQRLETVRGQLEQTGSDAEVNELCRRRKEIQTLTAQAQADRDTARRTVPDLERWQKEVTRCEDLGRRMTLSIDQERELNTATRTVAELTKRIEELNTRAAAAEARIPQLQAELKALRDGGVFVSGSEPGSVTVISGELAEILKDNGADDEDE